VFAWFIPIFPHINTSLCLCCLCVIWGFICSVYQAHSYSGCGAETVHVYQIVQHHIPEVHELWERRQRTYLGHHLYLLKCMILLTDAMIFRIFLFHIMVCKPILSAVDRRKGKTGEWDVLWQFHPWPYWPTVNCQACKYYYLLWMVEWCNWCDTRGMEDMVGNKVMNVN
jgi:hypothetical protein